MARKQELDAVPDAAEPRRRSSRLKRSLPSEKESLNNGTSTVVKLHQAQPKSGKSKKRQKTKVAEDADLSSTMVRNTESNAQALPKHSDDEHSYWLMKAEPESRMENGIDVKFSIDDLEACTEPEPWEGVRNHVAKNNMLAMKKGDLAFLYHSNCKVPGIAGVMKIVEESSVDKSAFDKQHPYFDSKSDPEKPRWFHVHVGFERRLPRFISLKELQSYKTSGGQPLENMQLHKQSRLSVSKVSKTEWDFILDLANQEAASTTPVTK